MGKGNGSVSATQLDKKTNKKKNKTEPKQKPQNFLQSASLKLPARKVMELDVYTEYPNKWVVYSYVGIQQRKGGWGLGMRDPGGQASWQKPWV